MATLKFVKQTKLANNLYPFFAHVDFNLISKQDNINLQITKLSNGLIRFESQKFQVYTSAIKSGCRHVDEKAKISTKVILDSWLDVVDADAGVKLKESKVKATFKIEINDEEKKVRDSTTTNQYHTGLANAIVMSKEDLLELENSQMQRIEEEGEKGSDEDPDEDDPDDDLDF